MQLNINLSPQLLQTITAETIQQLEILQLSTIDLASYIYEKANENPLLTVVEHQMSHIKDIVDLAKTASVSKASTSTKFNEYIQNQLVQQENDYQFLLQQIPFQRGLTRQDEKILRYLINHLDERLFLNIDLMEVAHVFRTSVLHIESLISRLQSFDPLGVGTRNVVDFLTFQIMQDSQSPEYALIFVQKHLEDIANLNIKRLAKKHRISIEETMRTIEYIRQLQPFPKNMKEKYDPPFIIPDMHVTKLADEWIIEFNNQLLPKVTLNEMYMNLLQRESSHKNYYEGCLKDAMLLLQGIEDRQKTLYRLVRLLIETQATFFEGGLVGLKPMRLKDAADLLDLHESTVSRSIRNKYLRTPHGVFAFKVLFAKGVSNDEGELQTVEAVKALITQFIKAEDKQKPLSDQQLMNELREKNIHISRRTVAKYREALNFPNSAKRVYL